MYIYISIKWSLQSKHGLFALYCFLSIANYVELFCPFTENHRRTIDGDQEVASGYFPRLRYLRALLLATWSIRILNGNTVNCTRCRPGQRAAPWRNWKPGRHEAVNFIKMSDKRTIIPGRSLAAALFGNKRDRERESGRVPQAICPFLLSPYATVETFDPHVASSKSSPCLLYSKQHVRHGGLPFCASLSADCRFDVSLAAPEITI